MRPTRIGSLLLTGALAALAATSAAGAELSIACGAVGVELELCAEAVA